MIRAPDCWDWQIVFTERGFTLDHMCPAVPEGEPVELKELAGGWGCERCDSAAAYAGAAPVEGARLN